MKLSTNVIDSRFANIINKGIIAKTNYSEQAQTGNVKWNFSKIERIAS